MKTEEFEDLVKQVYFYCENKDPNGLYPDRDIDLREFASKLLAVYEAKIKAESQTHVCSLLAPTPRPPQSL
jgi:hypothetical protein